MNGILTKRAAYYSLLIVSLAAGLLVMFLPFAYQVVYGHPYSDRFLGSVSILHYLSDDMTYRLVDWSDEFPYFFDLFLRLFALVTAAMLVRSLLRALGSLNEEVSSFAALRLGIGPVLGICYFVLLLVLGVLNRVYLNEQMPYLFLSPPFWPVVGLLLNCASLGLARALNP